MRMTLASDLPHDIPLDSPLRTHPKKGLPIGLSSTYPHGHISGHPRTLMQQAAFEARKQEILQTLTAAEIDDHYTEVCEQIKSKLAQIELDERAWKQEVDDLKRTREIERRAWKKMNELSRTMDRRNADKMEE